YERFCRRTENSTKERFFDEQDDVSASGRFVNDIRRSVEKFFGISFPNETRNHQRPRAFFEHHCVRAFFGISKEIVSRKNDRDLVPANAVIYRNGAVNGRAHYRT